MVNTLNYSTSNVIYVQIVSFIIKIEFKQHINDKEFVDDLYQRTLFIKQLRKYFKNFTLVNIPQGSDYTIVVESAHPMFIKTKEIKNVSIPLFKKISEQKVKTFYYINIYQFQIILRDILFHLTTKNNGCVVHASAIAVSNTAYIFLGKSTAGKSTIIRLLKNRFIPLVDDLVFIRKEGNKYFLYQTPFMEKQWWIKKYNYKYELRCIFLIHKNEKSSVKKIDDTTHILNFWLNQILIARENKKKVIQWSLRLIKSSIQFHELNFRKNRKDLEDIITVVESN